MSVRLFPSAVAVAAVAALVGLAGSGLSCSANTTPVPIRTFERPQKMALACLHVNAADGGPEAQVTPQPVAACPPVPPNVSGVDFENHLYALVTQRSRGELAVVDLTAGAIVDEDRSTPGVNLIPVGAVPSDVVTSPDSLVAAAAGPAGADASAGSSGTGAPATTFVSSEDPNGYAIYAIPSDRLLGDSTGAGTTPLRLTDLRACSLPQSPQALGVLARPAPGGTSGAGYVLVALLRSRAGSPARLVTIDPAPLLAMTPGSVAPCSIVGATALNGAVPGTSAPPETWPDGVPYADAGTGLDTDAGLVAACMALSIDGGRDGAPGAGSVGPADGQAPDAAPPADAASGGALDAAPAPDAPADGLAEADVGVSPVASADATVDAGSGSADTASGADAGSGPADAGSASADAGPLAPPAASAAMAALPLGPPRPTALVVRDDAPIAYVADGALPLIHVVDLGDPTAPREVQPLLATSAAQPTRAVQVRGLALSPVTRDLRRYLYAVDAGDGTLMVFDATSPSPAGPSPVPMRRPHPELNPFAPVDRIAFAAPVAAVTFVQHDWPLTPPVAGPDGVHAYTGLLCNPNPNAIGSGGAFVSGGLGGYYRADQVSVINSQGAGVQGLPTRLRGVFALVALSNGNLATVDVDDWDAPCRRPDPMETEGGLPDFQTGVLDVPEPAPLGAGDLDPYRAPRTVAPNGSAGVTQEVFFPVSSPHRLRSNFLLRNDPTSGQHLPFLSTAPQLFDVGGAPVSFSTTAGPSILLPTALPPGFVDPSHITNPTSPTDQYTFDSVALGTAAGQSMDSSLLFPGSPQIAPGVRISYDDPTAHIDQDWTLTYEGVLPTAAAIVADIGSADGTYQTLTFSEAPTANGGTGPGGARFCDRGVEDADVGAQRAALMLRTLPDYGLPTADVKDQARWTADYVEITDDLLGQNDPYWSQDDSCWDGLPPLSDGTSLSSDVKIGDATKQASGRVAGERYGLCARTFSSSANADSFYTRDFPILRATTSALVVGTFATPIGVSESPQVRTIVGADPSNVVPLKVATCCFHRQVGFKIRAGGEWVVSGQVGQNPGLGLLHHVATDPATGRCVPRCDDPSKLLLSGRAFEIPPPPTACSGVAGAKPIDRDSPLAMRNPMFSFVMWRSCTEPPASMQHTLTARDQQWRFSLRGGYSPISVPIAGTTGVAAAPQSMLAVGPFGQLAVVDGAAQGQGLVLIDLNTLAIAHSPYN